MTISREGSVNTLDTQILERSKEVSTDAYSMSVGELISLYRDGELEIHPEFQRFFRWEPEQKARFVESILLGIPLPSVFMSQTDRGKWEVVDGLQRISTLLELVGELRDQSGALQPPLVLSKTRYLPALEGRRWSKVDEEGPEFLSEAAKLKIKRARIDVRIVLNTSDPFAKYELFQRLNTGGSHATEQEVRNCILLMVNREFFAWLSDLAAYSPFKECLPLTDRSMKEQFHVELLVRFLVLRRLSVQEVVGFGELGEFLTERIVTMATDPSFSRQDEETAFKRTFDLLYSVLEEDAFRRYDRTKNRATGATLISSFEVMALGIGHYAGDASNLPAPERVREVHASLWNLDGFRTNVGSGVRASTRIPLTLELGRRLFAPA